ncbi:MAG: trypsin-like peptidase domain-containing protein [Acidobacteriota bacterium]
MTILVVSWLLVPGPVSAQSPAATETPLSQLSESFETLAQQVGPAVVQIFATGYRSDLLTADSSLLSKNRSSGSGVILDSQGYIVTNAHVVTGAQTIQVLLSRLPEGTPTGTSILRPRGEILDAEIVGLDPESDLAVLKIPGRELPFVELGDSDQLKQGQLVMAFGNPFGLENSVTLGVVSAVGRQLQPEDPMVYIQTDAPINPGNSGGPLIDARGNLVGINTFIFSQSGGSDGIGFAVPSNIVRNVFTQIRDSGRVARGEIGVHAQTISTTLAAGLGLPRPWGVILGDVYPGRPAALSGLKVGDVVLTLDGKAMENGRQFDVNLYRRPIGETVTLEIQRDSRELTFRVRVVEQTNDQGRFAGMVTPEKNLIPELGILGIDIDSEVALLLPSPRKLGGVLVALRSPSSPYWGEGFLPGDVIYSINAKEIKNLANLRVQLAELKSGDPVAFQVQRGNALTFIALDLE